MATLRSPKISVYVFPHPIGLLRVLDARLHDAVILRLLSALRSSPESLRTSGETALLKRPTHAPARPLPSAPAPRGPRTALRPTSAPAIAPSPTRAPRPAPIAR